MLCVVAILLIKKLCYKAAISWNSGNKLELHSNCILHWTPVHSGKDLASRVDKLDPQTQREATTTTITLIRPILGHFELPTVLII